MSLKGPLRRLERGVRWLETEGRYRRVAIRMKTLERLQEIADRVAVDPAFAARWKKDFSYVPLPPPSRAAATLRAAEVRVVPVVADVRVEPVVEEAVVEPVSVEPEPTSAPSPDMEIRPVWWRARGAEEEYRSGSYGRCIAEYDPLRDDDDDGDG